jgi:hypothetical protein
LLAIANKLFISGQVPISHHYISIGYSELGVLPTVRYNESILPSLQLTSSAYSEQLRKKNVTNCNRVCDDYTTAPPARMHTAQTCDIVLTASKKGKRPGL